MKTALILLVCHGLYAQGSLDVAPGSQGMVDRYLTGIAVTQLKTRAERLAAIRTAAEVAARQAYIRTQMLKEIGGWPEKTPLNARIAGTLERDGYKVEKLIFESQPHFYVTANVFVPAGGARPPFPAVLGTAGHSQDGKASELYERAWVALAKRGFLVLAYDPPGQGERLQYFDEAAGKGRLRAGGTAEHDMAGIQCLLTGTSIARYFIWDGIRAVDYLLTRPDVDPKRIAVAGNSGGGTQSTYLAAMEPRLAAAAPSCYITSWEKLWAGPGPQDAEQDFVDFLKDGFDFPDFLIAFAPKPIQMAVATKDFFPIEGAKATYAEARRVFQILNAGDRMGFFEFDDTHGWSKPRREATYRWFARWLQNRVDDGTEPEFNVDSPEALRSTETGQVATSLRDAATIQSLNAALAERLHAGRRGAGGKNIPALVRARLRVTIARGAVPAGKEGEIERQGYRIEKIRIEPEAGIIEPALAFVPAAGAARKPAVIYVNPAGKSADAGEGGPIEAIARQGRIVLAVDPRGWGETASPAGRVSGYPIAHQTVMRALLVGKNMPGMQTEDLLRAFDYLASRRDVDPRRISIVAKGKASAIAMFAAVLEPRVEKVSCEDPIESYLALTRLVTHGDIDDIVIPGVLRDFDLPDVAAALGRRYARRR